MNKTESKVELRVAVSAIIGLSLRASDRLADLAGERLTEDGELILVCEETRSQRQNRELVIERFIELVRDARAVPKIRRVSKPTWGSKQRRLQDKSLLADKKKLRKPE